MTPGSKTDSAAGSSSVKSERLVILAVTLGIVLAPLNSTMIAVALPGIMEHFEAQISSAGWLVTAYLIAMASLQPLAGKLGDRFGHRRLVLIGLSFFGFASIGAALAPSLSLLLGFRVGQAICAALIVPNGSALLRHALSENARGSGYGLMGAGIAVAAAAGPPLGGLLVEGFGWRSIFTVNLFFVAPALLLGWKSLPVKKMELPAAIFDKVGAILLPCLLVLAAWVLLSFSRGSGYGVLLIGIPVALVGALILTWYERRHPDPLFPVEFFRNKSFCASAAGIAFGNLAMYSLLVALPLLLASRNDSALKIGLILATMSAGMTVFSFVGGRMIDRFGRRFPTTAGLALLTVGIAPIALGGADVSLGPMLLGLSLVGVGLGLATPGLQTSAVEAVEAHQAGLASGLYSTSRYLGSITGSAVIAGVLGAGQVGEAIGLVFYLSLAAAGMAAIATLGLQQRPRTSMA